MCLSDAGSHRVEASMTALSGHWTRAAVDTAATGADHGRSTLQCTVVGQLGRFLLFLGGGHLGW